MATNSQRSTVHGGMWPYIGCVVDIDEASVEKHVDDARVSILTGNEQCGCSILFVDTDDSKSESDHPHT